jgi:hypothetical protein
MDMETLASDVVSSGFAVLPGTDIVRRVRAGENALFEIPQC